MPRYRCHRQGSLILNGDWCSTCYWQDKYRHLEGTYVKLPIPIKGDIGTSSCPCDVHGADKVCYWRAKYQGLETQ